MLGRSTPQERVPLLAYSGFIIVTGAGMFLYLGSLLSQRVGPVAQLGLEHLAHNQVDVGSNPSRPTTSQPLVGVFNLRVSLQELFYEGGYLG